MWFINHSAKGTTWSNHKYIRKEGDRYIYPSSNSNGGNALTKSTEKNLADIMSQKEAEYNSAKEKYEQSKNSQIGGNILTKSTEQNYSKNLSEKEAEYKAAKEKYDNYKKSNTSKKSTNTNSSSKNILTKSTNEFNDKIQKKKEADNKAAKEKRAQYLNDKMLNKLDAKKNNNKVAKFVSNRKKRKETIGTSTNKKIKTFIKKGGKATKRKETSKRVLNAISNIGFSLLASPEAKIIKSVSKTRKKR